MIHNPCDGCGRKPHCPEPCRLKEDYRRACRKSKRHSDNKNHGREGPTSATKKTVKYICDRCHAEEVMETDYNGVRPPEWSSKIVNERRYDLCPGCTEAYNDAIERFWLFGKEKV